MITHEQSNFTILNPTNLNYIPQTISIIERFHFCEIENKKIELKYIV